MVGTFGPALAEADELPVGLGADHQTPISRA
jgi:hypothetical protein